MPPKRLMRLPLAAEKNIEDTKDTDTNTAMSFAGAPNTGATSVAITGIVMNRRTVVICVASMAATVNGRLTRGVALSLMLRFH